MSFRQPRYIAPADPNVVSKAVMKATTEGYQTYACRQNPAACSDKDDDDDGNDKKPKQPKQPKQPQQPQQPQPKASGKKNNFSTGVSGTVGGVYNVNYDPMDPSTWD